MKTTEDLGNETRTPRADVGSKETGHTPGPWEVQSDRGGASTIVVSTYAQLETGVCKLYGAGERKQANARLIAAAPELLWFAKQILSELPSKRDWLNPDLEKIGNAVVAKAEGRSLSPDVNSSRGVSVSDQE